MAPFRWRRHKTSAGDVVQHRFAEPGAGGDDRDVAAFERLPFLQHVHLGRRQHGHRVGHRLQIVQQRHAREFEARPHTPCVDIERDVGEFRRVVDHRSGDAKAGGLDR